MRVSIGFQWGCGGVGAVGFAARGGGFRGGVGVGRGVGVGMGVEFA